jgi:hypothetical protein
LGRLQYVHKTQDQYLYYPDGWTFDHKTHFSLNPDQNAVMDLCTKSRVSINAEIAQSGTYSTSSFVGIIPRHSPLIFPHTEYYSDYFLIFGTIIQY